MDKFQIVRFDKIYDRRPFSCGQEELDSYLKTKVSQDLKRRVTSCFLAISDGSIAGYYTLSATSVPLYELPKPVLKKLPRYPSIPAIRMGRLAVDNQFKGLGLGRALLFDALKRCIDLNIGAFALVVDAKDEMAANFYEKHGFIKFEEKPLTLFLPLATAKSLLSPGPLD